MPDRPPIVTNNAGTRQFACFAGAALVFVVNPQGQILMLSHPRARGGWEVINGALEHGETILDGALRELREEAGPHLRVKPLGTIHAYTHVYEAGLQMISVCYLMAYQSGEVVPGDDMAGSAVGWFTPAQIEDESFRSIAPTQKWLMGRAVELYHLWRDQDHPFEKGPGEHGGAKYGG